MKRLDQLTQLTAAQLAQDDIIGIRDQSAGQTKYITVKDLTGSPENGWQATGESWTFSSYSSTTNIGVVTVPTDATTKYAVGMFVRIAQTTGGTKYGRILSITSTTLSIWFGGVYTLNNEAITSPVYSTVSKPVGIPITISEGQPYRFSAYRAGAKSSGTSAFTNLNTETKLYDGAGVLDVTTNVGRFTAPVAGYYDIAGIAALNGANADCLISIYKNGARFTDGNRFNGSGPITQPVLSTQIFLNAGDYVELYVFTAAAWTIIVGTSPSISTLFSGHITSR